ncbi:ATP-binding protein [Nocardioides marmoraquaticus]
MHRPRALRSPGPSLLLAGGLAAYVASLWLPWRDTELVLGAVTRGVMALAGVTLLALVARVPPRRPLRTPLLLLGASVVAYPSVLALAATQRSGPVVETLAAGWHTLPLTLVQLVPLLASARAVGRRHRRPEHMVVVVAVVGAALTVVSLALAPGSVLLLAVASALWFGSFAVAPVVTWLAVRGTSGEVRRRALVAALASLVPVVVITGCVTLGLLSPALGASGPETPTTLLMLGFSAGTLLCGCLGLGAVGPHDGALLQTGVVLATLHGVLAGLSLVLGTVAAVVCGSASVPTAGAVATGVAVALVAGLSWWWLHGWTRRVVDPAEAVRHELALVGRDDDERGALVHVLRRVTGDPDLVVAYPGAGDHEPGDGVVLARDVAGAATVVALPRDEAARGRLRALGDADDVVRPALLEARLAQQARRAEDAAAHERRRLRGDLHDGLQGRLIGLALQLQLGARTLEDPAAALLAEEAVTGLRAAVDDVRALAGGRLPDVLVDHGLPPALRALLRPVGSLVDLDLPERRFGPRAEATAYFLVGEAVTNALKHAEAGRVRVRVWLPDDARVCVVVEDDGQGGADPRLGSGLRGLAERVAAAGGSLVVRDGPTGTDGPRGTAVEAVLPCGS